ncbi:MAG: long-chain fatty acid--CoA ligase [Candidatus Marinimicrobia bacterium]|nr:long-chain fatty acid--CoA ligase [Candidatus Neomarinimicrobiota bacterium]
MSRNLVFHNTIAEMFDTSTKKFRDKVAYRFKENGIIKSLTFGEVRSTVEKISGGLRKIGLDKGDKVGIIAQNSPYWAMCDYGIIISGGATVTIYPTLTAKQAKWIIQHSESRFIFAGDREQSEKVVSIIDDLPKIEKVIVMDNTYIDNEKFISLDCLMKLGDEYIKEHPGFFEKFITNTAKDDLLTLIYTSGTTGEPKGVMLTHENLTSNIYGSLHVLEVDHKDVFLSFLPLSHSFERMAGHYLTFSIGAEVFYAESIEKVAENLLEARPTVMTTVPRLFEKVYARVIENVSKFSKIKQKLFWTSISKGKKVCKKKAEGKNPDIFTTISYSILKKIVLSKLKERVGGRLRFAVSGGAPMPKEIGEFFNAANIKILEGYGLTETSPVVSVNPLEQNRIGTVGPPLPNVEVKIAEDGEILVRGKNVMLGYYKNEEATREVIDEEGWLRTGDIGILDKFGYLIITDRKKNIIVTSGGKNVAPQPMENALASSKWIEQVLIIGDKRRFVSALIVPEFVNLERWAEEKGLAWKSREDLINLKEVQELYERVIEESMEGFAQFEKVKKFRLLSKEFTIEEGELTPSLKIRRKIVEEKYKNIIDEIYRE